MEVLTTNFHGKCELTSALKCMVMSRGGGASVATPFACVAERERARESEKGRL